MKPKLRSGKNGVKYMQTLNKRIYHDLENQGRVRGINVQELIRAVIIPEWRQEQNGMAELKEMRIAMARKK